MALGGILTKAASILALVTLAACGDGGFGSRETAAQQVNPRTIARDARASRTQSSIFDLFDNRDDPNVTLGVNRYLWAASLDVLSFLPVQQADPFGGVIQFGFGTPPGSGRAYQATVLIQDPALDARSLNVSLRTRGGTVDRETLREVENAILTRARQLRIQDSRL